MSGPGNVEQIAPFSKLLQDFQDIKIKSYLFFVFRFFFFRFFFFLTFFLEGSADNCNMEDWSRSFSQKGFTSCSSRDGYYYITGFEKTDDDSLLGLKKAKCCRRSQTFWNVPTQCQMPNWMSTMGK